MEMERPQRRQSVSLRKLHDECLLYDEQKNKLHVLNEVAGFVWELCDGSHSMGDIENSVREAYSVPDEVNLAADLRHIIDAFAGLELLQPGHLERP